MKKLIAIPLLLCCCNKEDPKFEDPGIQPPYTISATDTAYRAGDSLQLWTNRKPAHPASSLVYPGDSVIVYYNPNGKKTTKNNYLIISLNNKSKILKSHADTSGAIVSDTLIIPRI